MIRRISDLNSDARLWVYQSDRELNQSEVEVCVQALEAFVNGWASHGVKVQGAFEVRYNRFIVLAGQVNGEISGCSIDSSVAVIKNLEQELGVDFFNRQLILYKEGEEIREAQMHEFWAMRKAGIVTDDHMVFNNLVDQAGSYPDSWVVPFSESWHADMW